MTQIDPNPDYVNDIQDVRDGRSRQEMVKDFSEVLSTIDSMSEKKKKLLKEIYENAITDRHNSFVLFQQLCKITQDKSTEHAVHGKTMTIYIEKMSKANDQLIKLAELIDKCRESVSQVETNEDDIYDSISKRHVN